MATGLCTAAVTLTAQEIARLEELPHAVNQVQEADGCQFRGGHRGRHAYLVQVQDFEGEAWKPWWVVWSGPAEPDATGYEIIHLPPCPEESGDEECRHPAGHLDDHRFD